LFDTIFVLSNDAHQSSIVYVCVVENGLLDGNSEDDLDDGWMYDYAVVYIYRCSDDTNYRMATDPVKVSVPRHNMSISEWMTKKYTCRHAICPPSAALLQI